MKTVPAITLTVPTERKHSFKVGEQFDPKKFGQYKKAVLERPYKIVAPVFENEKDFLRALDGIVTQRGYSLENPDAPVYDCLITYDGDLATICQLNRFLRGEEHRNADEEDLIVSNREAIRLLLQMQAPSILPIFNEKFEEYLLKKAK